MIAITPMPPTISAMDEMTTSDSSTAWEIWSHTLSTASWVTRSKSLGLSSVRPWRMRITASTSLHRDLARDVVARHHRNHHRLAAKRPSPHAFVAELLAERGVGNDREVVLAQAEAARGRPLVDHAEHRVVERADADVLADRIDAARLEQRLVWPVTDHRDAPAPQHLLLGEDPPGQQLREVHVHEALAGAHDRGGAGSIAAVEHALHRRLGRPGAEPGVHDRRSTAPAAESPRRRRW